MPGLERRWTNGHVWLARIELGIETETVNFWLFARCLVITNTIFKCNEHHKKEMDKTLAGLQHQESEIVEENWSSLEAAIYDTALSVLGKSNCKHQDCFNDTDKKLLEERNTARMKKLQVNTRSNRTKLTGTRRSLKQYTREMKCQRWEAKEAKNKRYERTFKMIWQKYMGHRRGVQHNLLTLLVRQ